MNDDLGQLATLSEAAGRGAARVTGDAVFSLLTTNAAMSDGIALFHASHGNLGTAGAPSVTALDELRGLMAQAGPAGENLNISPAILIGPPDRESTLTVLRGSMVDTVDPDPLAGSDYKSGSLVVCTDGRLGPSTTAWFAVANPRQFSGIEVVTLEGRNKRPMFEQVKGPLNRDGVTYRLTHDVAAIVVDYRTLAMNAGA